MRHLVWVITFSDVENSYYWDRDNDMVLSYDWNYPGYGGVLTLEGGAHDYTMTFTKTVDGDKLVNEYWSK